MKLFLDTANTKEIKEASSLGILDGVTTNPSLIAKEGRDFKELILEICTLVNGPVSVEVVSTDEVGMLREAHKIAPLHPNVVVKIPILADGLKAISQLSREGIKVNTTLIFSPTQALLAAKVGAAYVSPFIGRLDDVSTDGMDLIAQILEIFSHYSYQTEVLVASIRHPMHVVEAARLGAHVVTMPFAVFRKLLSHPLTDVGLKQFLADWDKLSPKPSFDTL